MAAITGLWKAFSIREDSYKRTPIQPGSFRKKEFLWISEIVFKLLLTAPVHWNKILLKISNVVFVNL